MGARIKIQPRSKIQYPMKNQCNVTTSFDCKQYHFRVISLTKNVFSIIPFISLHADSQKIIFNNYPEEIAWFWYNHYEGRFNYLLICMSLFYQPVCHKKVFLTQKKKGMNKTIEQIIQFGNTTPEELFDIFLNPKNTLPSTGEQNLKSQKRKARNFPWSTVI